MSIKYTVVYTTLTVLIAHVHNTQDDNKAEETTTVIPNDIHDFVERMDKDDDDDEEVWLLCV